MVGAHAAWITLGSGGKTQVLYYPPNSSDTKDLTLHLKPNEVKTDIALKVKFDTGDWNTLSPRDGRYQNWLGFTMNSCATFAGGGLAPGHYVASQANVSSDGHYVYGWIFLDQSDSTNEFEFTLSVSKRSASGQGDALAARPMGFSGDGEAQVFDSGMVADPNGGDPTLSMPSVATSTSLGRLPVGDHFSAAMLGFNVPLDEVSTLDASSLVYSSLGEDAPVEVIRDGVGNVLQARAPEGFVLVSSSGSGFRVDSYYPADVTYQAGQSGYTIHSGAAPYSSSVYTRLAPGGTHSGGVTVEETVDGVTRTSSILYLGSNANGGVGWQVVSGGGTEVLEHLTFLTQSSGVWRSTHSVTREVGGQTVSTSIRVHTLKPWGVALTSETTSLPGGAEQSDVYSYYENPSETWSYGKVSLVQHSNGSWERYFYFDSSEEGSSGMVSAVCRPWMDGVAAPDALSLPATGGIAGCVVERYEYGSWSNGDSGARTKMWHYVDGTLVSISESGTSVDALNWDPQAALNVSGVSKNGQIETSVSDGLVRSSSSFSWSDGLGAASASSDGTLQYTTTEAGTWNAGTGAFTPSAGGTSHRATTTVTLQGSEGGVAGRSTRRIEITDAYGLVVSATTQVKVSASEWAATEAHGFVYDTRQRLVLETLNGVAVQAVSYPAGNIEVRADQAGTTIRTTRDASGRVTSTVKLGTGGGGATAPQADVTTTFAYSGLQTVRTLSGGGLSVSASTTVDGFEREVQSIDDAGLQRLTAYSTDGLQVTETAPGGATRITTRYKDGQLKSITGSAVTVAEYHDYQANVDYSVTETIHYGSAQGSRWIKRTTNGLGLVTKEERPGPGGGNIIVIYHYDDNGRLLRKEQPGLADVRYVYDGFGQIIKQGVDLDANGALEASSPDPVTVMSTYFEMQGNDPWEVTTTAQYVSQTEAQPVLSSITRRRLNAAPETEVIATDFDGAITTTTSAHDPATKTVVTTQSSDRSVYPVTQTVVNGLRVRETVQNAAGESIYSYDALERQDTIEEPTGIAFRTVYDDPGGGVARFRVKEQGIRPAGATAFQTTATYDYDDRGRLSSSTNAAGKTTVYAYNDRDQVTSQSGSATYPVAFHYNTYGQMDEMRTFRDGVLSATGGDLTTWGYHEPSGFLIAKTDAASMTVNYTYHSSGLLHTRQWARLTGGGERVTSTYAYDGAGRTTQVTYNDGTPAVSFTYYRNGFAKTMQDAAGLHSYTPAELNNGTAKEDIAGIGPVAGATEILEGRDNLNRRASWQLKVDGQTISSVGCSHAASGQLGTVSGAGGVWTYGYDAATGRQTGTTAAFAAGASIVGSRTYTPAGQVDAIRYTRSGQDLLGWDYAYDPSLFQRRTGTTSVIPGLPGWSYGYNDRSEVTSAERTDAAGAPVAGQAWGYQYDGIGNRTTSTRTRSGDTALTTTYLPNALNQYSSITRPDLTEVSGQTLPGVDRLSVNGQPPTGRPPTNGEPGGFSAWVEADDGDATILRWPQAEVVAFKTGEGGATAIRQGRAYVRPSETPVHDADGNLLSDAMWLCTWDAENRLTSMEQRAEGVPLSLPLVRLEFGYDGRSRRVFKRVLLQLPAPAGQGARPAQWTLARFSRFWYDEWNLMAEETQKAGADPSSIWRTYIWGTDLSGTMQGAGGVGGLLGLASGTTTCAVCSDANGNVTGLVEGLSGTLVARWDYDAFGNLVSDWVSLTMSSSALCPFRFSTKYHDPESQWLYYGYRYYSPETGRWLSRDPIAERGGVNLYGMVGNDAVNRWDYLGLAKLKVSGQAFQEGYIGSKVAIMGAILSSASSDLANRPNKWTGGVGHFARPSNTADPKAAYDVLYIEFIARSTRSYKKPQGGLPPGYSAWPRPDDIFPEIRQFLKVFIRNNKIEAEKVGDPPDYMVGSPYAIPSQSGQNNAGTAVCMMLQAKFKGENGISFDGSAMGGWTPDKQVIGGGGTVPDDYSKNDRSQDKGTNVTGPGYFGPPGTGGTENPYNYPVDAIYKDPTTGKPVNPTDPGRGGKGELARVLMKIYMTME